MVCPKKVWVSERRSSQLFVAATLDCFPRLSLEAALSKLTDLEYTRVEIGVHEQGPHLRPSEVAADLDRAIHRIRDTHRLTPVALSVECAGKGQIAYEHFSACAKLAKATKIVSLTVPASPLGTPFNEEIERLRELVRIAGTEGVLVSVRTEGGKTTQDPTTALALVNNVRGLGITLDPSHYVYGPGAGGDYEPLLPHIYHVCLRDTNEEQLQVRVGQGHIEYGKLVNQLHRFGYKRALSVHVMDYAEADIDHDTEMRKMRLLLETLV